MVASKRQGHAEVTRLWAQLANPLLGYCRQFVKDPQDALEIRQEVFRRLIERMAQADPLREPAAWAYKVAWCLCQDRLRRRGRTVSADEVAEPAVVESPELDLEWKLIREALESGMSKLSEEQLQTVFEKYRVGLSMVEISARHRVNPNTVKSRDHAARRKIRQSLDRRGISRTPQ